MKKNLLHFLLMFLAVVIIAFGIFSAVTVFAKPDISILKSTIETIGVANKIDTVYDEDYLETGYYSGNSHLAIDNEDGMIMGMYVETGVVIALEVSYSKQFLSNKINIDTLSIEYVDYKNKVYFAVEFHQEGIVYKSTMTAHAYTDYLATLDIPTIYKYLQTCPLTAEETV